MTVYEDFKDADIYSNRNETEMALHIAAWKDGKGGCPTHRKLRDGSCHECAMNQPHPEDLL